MRTEFNTLTDFYHYILEEEKDNSWVSYLDFGIKDNPPKLIQSESLGSTNIFCLSPVISPKRLRLKELEGRVVTINNQHYLVSTSIYNSTQFEQL